MSAANPLITMPTKSSGDAAWIAWYDLLPFSEKDNNLLFTRAWKYRGSKAANTSSLHDTLKKHGLNLAADNIIGEIQNWEHGVLDTVGNALSISMTTTLLFGVPVLIFAGAIIWRLATPEATGVILGTAAKTYSGKP